MRFFAVVFASIVANLLVQSADSSYDNCSTKELGSLAPLGAECAELSGLAFPPTTKPSDMVLKLACSNEKCTEYATKLSALQLGDCLFGAAKLTTDLLGPMTLLCGESTPPITVKGSSAIRQLKASSSAIRPASNSNFSLEKLLPPRCFKAKQSPNEFMVCFDTNKAVQSVPGGEVFSIGRAQPYDVGFKPDFIDFIGGDYCGATERKLRLMLVCGDDYKLRDGIEPSRCSYSAEFVTPGACDLPKPVLPKKCIEIYLGQLPVKACFDIGEIRQNNITGVGSVLMCKLVPFDETTIPSTINFAGGESCDIPGLTRSISLTIKCAEEYKLLDIVEPSKCVYTSTFQSPGACSSIDIASKSPPASTPSTSSDDSGTSTNGYKASSSIPTGALIAVMLAVFVFVAVVYWCCKKETDESAEHVEASLSQTEMDRNEGPLMPVTPTVTDYVRVVASPSIRDTKSRTETDSQGRTTTSSGTGSQRAPRPKRQSDTAAWEDPAILAVRVA